jgi:hypothetical protein
LNDDLKGPTAGFSPLSSTDVVSYTAIFTDGRSAVIQFTPVPEPLGLVGLFATGAGLILSRRRRAKQ